MTALNVSSLLPAKKHKLTDLPENLDSSFITKRVLQ